MKKIVLFVASILTAGAMMAQTIVSTDVEKRNVILEEFTGVGCGFCPDGHARANAICQQYDGHAWSINIHAGGYANGSGYTTDDGDAIHEEFSGEISGYPCGTVNRGSVQGRGDWAATAANVRSQDSPVNVAATAAIDPMTRQLTVEVEAYYTGTQSVSSNYITVALVQNNILGPQTNNGPYNTDYVEGNLYRHMHMLRDVINGPWGDEINNLSTGALFQRTYTYQLPAAIDIVPITDFDDIEVIVFISESHRNIITGTKAEKTILPGFYISKFEVDNEDCSLTFQPKVTLTNTFDTSVTAFSLNYNGTITEYPTSVAPGTSTTIELAPYIISNMPESYVHVNEQASVSIDIFTVNDEETGVSAAPITATLADLEIYTAAGPFLLDIALDHYGSETKAYWISQENCSPLWTSPNFPNNQAQQLQPARHKFFSIDPATPGLYILRVTDNYGDGMLYVSDEPGFWLYTVDAAGNRTQLLHNDGSFSDKAEYFINVTNSGSGQYLGADNVAEVRFSVYPNPTTDRLNIECGEVITRVEVLDVTGRTVLSQNGNVNSISTQALAEGVYMLRVVSNSGVSAQKFVKE